MLWVMPEAAADRITRTLTGPRQLTRAIAEAGHELSVIPYAGDDDVLDLPHRDDVPVTLYGGHRFLEHALRERPDLAPTVFVDTVSTSHTVVLNRLGGRMLNADARTMPCAEAAARVQRDETLFVRPVRGDKAFAGGLFTPVRHDALLTDPDLDVVVAPPKQLIAEYRFVIIDGRVITGSQYRRDNKNDVRIDVNPACQDFAQEVVSHYAPLRAFVCDVAETPDGPRVVEYNSFSAAGLYACDGRIILKAIAELCADQVAPAGYFA